jgi:hypothetical protein
MKNYFFITILLLSGYFLQAQIVNIPDTNFLSALILDGVDTNVDGEIQVSEAEATIVLHVGGNNISSLEGIQYFINLEHLVCGSNDITSLDLTNNINLIILECYYNPLTDVNITGLQFLESIYCQHTLLSSLDVTQNPNLNDFWCLSSQFTSIDVSQNLNLKHLYSSNNPISSLNLSQNVALEALQTDSCSELVEINLRNGNNINLQALWAHNNQNLSCIQVDDISYAQTAANWFVDDLAIYSENCFLGVVNFENTNLNIYPNPVQNTLNIISEIPFDKLKIYTLQGELIYETKINKIDVSLLSTGVYFISVKIDGKNIIKIFIKD